jgi:type VI secretion system protein
MKNRRLLDRIRNREENAWKGAAAGRNSGYVTESVVSHLQRLLNSRQGTTLMDKGYGMPDITDISTTYPGSVVKVELMIQNTIERYEPRLKNVEVRFSFQDTNDYSINFEISATLETENRMKQIWLESSINPKGKMTVR